MKRITIFSWGYYGWGNAPKKFVQAVDAVERSREFKPPLFVEVRIQRTGRAEGFKGSNFEKLLGPKRYKWMKELGNVAIQKRAGPMKIADPSAASTLLDLAVEQADQDRRLLFFCGCQWPKEDGKIACHRTAVTSLVLKAARKQGVAIEVVEWPGGKPGHIDLKVKPDPFDSLAKGRLSIPLGERPKLAEVAGLPWGSTATVQVAGHSIHRTIGPARFERGKWVLPVFAFSQDSEAPLISFSKEASPLRRYFGLEATQS